MNTQQKCPNCGSQADEISRHTKSVDLTEISFRCKNQSCGSAFTGVLNLTRGGVPGAQNFNGQPLQTSMSGEIKTDC